ncbi:SIMPL domain-containing protein [Bacillus sp. DTU_2020_1000418_1_SI_GHA_SEK_038]|uniref:SIMPL domain-containing protein n=1 Tax=Bacillus sp. DTU_2020_1000418_1_SI_GHA_SEK_038 TaxID=3077585 RepID=UPI0028E433E5|nr:SIMPL domain-containing protein [Bacillus sp. DTU_2020_1000418_1_SI_GHA_SEK_038]WNS74190.1 SIMPL domain-containing protein [Bacillus sp. DTU_2020_1000418_1_SI_GHA_SEK_038]
MMYYQQPPFRTPLASGKRQNIIRVSGIGKVTVAPNRAEITLGVSTEDVQLEKAQNDNAAAIANIKNALNSIGIHDDQIRTVNYSIFPQYDYIEGKQIFRGYRVEHLLLITIGDIEKAGLVVDTAVKNGANIITGIKFSVNNPSQYEQQALSFAVIDSFQKAEAIARTLGVQLNNTPILIQEMGHRGEPFPIQTSAFVKSEAATAIQPGTLEISSQVLAEYTYLP